MEKGGTKRETRTRAINEIVGESEQCCRRGNFTRNTQL